MKHPDYFTSYRNAISDSLAALEVTDNQGNVFSHDDAFDAWVRSTRSVSAKSRQQFICGNGASAAFANHMALDWTKNGQVTTHSFSDSALLTAVANDLGVQAVFSSPLVWYGKEGDQLVTISSSGNSPNIIAAIETAREIGMFIVTLSGLKPDNASRLLGDLNFYIRAKTYGVVECAHQVLLHSWLDQYLGIEEWNRKAEQNMRYDQYNP